MKSVEFPATQIAEAVDTWIDTEAIVSSTSRNSFLDDFTSSRIQLGLALDNPRNFVAQKHISHHNRQRFWGEAMIAEPAHDFLVARHTFNALMQISGGMKRIYHTSAISADDYMRRKLSGSGTAINTTEAVEATLRSQTLPITAAEANIQALEQFEAAEAMLEQLRTRIPEDLGRDSSPAIDLLKDVQVGWIHVVTSGIIMAAGYRNGELERVPFLEAKSISDDPQVYYPFAS
jgi:hypothetical protein